MRRLLLTLLVLLLTTSLFAQAKPTRPDLIVVISIDQFRYDYTTRFLPYFSEGGFNRLLRTGATFTHALYPYATTETGPGHASIGTGYVPARSGIVANDWYDRISNSPVYCVADPRSKGGFSPINLAPDSLGDRLQERYPGSKVYGVALKDRAAILMAGRKATAAYWFDPKAASFTSSSYYRWNKALVESFNATVRDFIKAHERWEQSPFIPTADLARITHDPESLRRFKTERYGLGVGFPHPIQSAEALAYTPFGNQLVLDFAERLIDSETLGTEDGAPDLVFVGLSSPDYVGHSFGPDSLEVADSAVRTDRDLEHFFSDLDRRFGTRWMVAVTSDHGVQSIPEVARDLGRDAGRVSMKNPNASARTFADLASERRELEKRIAKKLGYVTTDASPIDKTFILHFEEPAIYLNWTRIRRLKLDGERVKRAVRDAAKELHGVSGAFTNSELMASNPEASGVELAVRESFRADRSGDVLITLAPGYIWSYADTGTTHGEPIEDDQHVPLMLWGNGIRAGKYDDRVAPTFLAKTLGAILGFEAGGPETQVLPCVAHP